MSYDNLSSVSQNVLKFYQQLTGEERRVPFILLATGQWFSLGTPVSYTNETDHQDITEILLKVVLNTISPNLDGK
jgi:hypothetical protein